MKACFSLCEGCNEPIRTDFLRKLDGKAYCVLCFDMHKPKDLGLKEEPCTLTIESSYSQTKP